MNIKQAKEYIRDAVRIYLKRDEYGEYRVPVERQRPVFLLGAPGIGKTAVMEQIAQELGIALVTYSMTHHTRQSALGLPVIRRREYGGEAFDISEYTMSEIIASIYETMEESGIREGILFLDEINCVSETLAPSMLQFLQYKVFGRHKVPEGWVIVTAGNPPEYNRSVREFDVATMDRLKIIDVEADFAVWKEYALDRGVHHCVVSYLELKKDDFYHMETTVRGRSYVTARGWEDLSGIIGLYEEEGLLVDEALVGQYVRNERIVREFCAYYDLYQKYKKDYRAEEILEGRAAAGTAERAAAAPFDERLSLMGLLLDRLFTQMRETVESMDYLSALMGQLTAFRAEAAGDQAGKPAELLRLREEGLAKTMETLEMANTLSAEARRRYRRLIRFLREARRAAHTLEGAEEVFGLLKERFEAEKERERQEVERVKGHMHGLFEFTVGAFGNGSELLILMTELTVHSGGARFIAMFGSADYDKYNGEMMLSERDNALAREIKELEL